MARQCSLGVLCFAGTRGHAHDRHHFASLLVERQRHLVHEPPPLQQIEGCERMPRAPVLEIAHGEAWLNGVRTDLEGLPQSLYQQRDWSRRAGSIVLSISPSTPLRRLEPWLDALRDSQYQTVVFAFTSLRVVVLGARGRTDLRGHCGVAVSLDHFVTQKHVFMTVEALLMVEPSQSGIVVPRNH